ncbi:MULTISPECIES: hypothetical protein [unclassified Serratia (in: enterobacteria)]|uniref:hypothetical protein n=1 Tax=unclassified Serratia (in: enterobacteria) TaxID=2647522 RepID=UPI0030766185
MTDTKNDAATRALLLLTEKLNHWRTGPDAAWNSTWPVFERLIVRHSEMKAVYVELEEKKVTDLRLWVLLEQCVFAGGFGTADRHAALRADHRELQVLCEDISVMSIQLAQLIRRRSEILNNSGCFNVDRMLRLTDYIDEAGYENGLYRTYIQPKLDELNGFDLRYWPDIADLLQTLGEEPAEVECRDEATAAIVGARRASHTDFFRQFFSRLCEVSDGSYRGLPLRFRLSDGAMATLSNIICDRPPDEMIDEVYVKRLRQRLRDQGFSAVW